MGVIVFNGESSVDHHLYVEKQPDYLANPREYETVHVPGRNGDLIIDKGGYQNVNRTYEVSLYDPNESFDKLSIDLSSWLNSPDTYCRLEDSYEPNIFRLAVYGNSLELENLFHEGGKGKLEFYCKPQRFLKMGERSRIFTKPFVLRNPTRFYSEPFILINGSGNVTLQVGAYPIQIKSLSSNIVIDSEIQDCYKGLVNQNGSVILEKGFPKLAPGSNTVTWSGSGITSVEVIPRWWTL